MADRCSKKIIIRLGADNNKIQINKIIRILKTIKEKSKNSRIQANNKQKTAINKQQNKRLI